MIDSDNLHLGWIFKIFQSMFIDIAITCLELEEMAMKAAENDGRLARRPSKHAEREVHAHCKLLMHTLTT